MTTGIIVAMPQELEQLARDLTDCERTDSRGSREYRSGAHLGEPVVVVQARVGKVAAASTATQLIHDFNVSRIIVTGVAGAIAPGLNAGDVVVAHELLQHDMDASPLFPRFELPLLGTARIGTDEGLRALAFDATRRFVTEDLADVLDEETRSSLGITSPNIVVGTIASGDEFIASAERSEALREAIPDLAAVEMEGAAVAQVCFEHAVPFVVIRTISDRADHEAAEHFDMAMPSMAGAYTRGILARLLPSLSGGD